jgi:OOP family OmpA-OmpF porin
MDEGRLIRTGIALLMTLGFAACETAPEAPDPGLAAVPADPAPAGPAPAAGPSAPAASIGSEAEAPEEVVPAVQLAYALVPPDSKSLAPGHGSEEYRIDLPTLTFEFNSATLTPQGRSQLDELGEALTYETAGPYRFRLTGHTDTAGPKEVNETLSWARAEAARDYLIQEYDIDAARIEIDGRGEDNPVMPTGDDVADWRNRRVEVVNLGPAA